MRPATDYIRHAAGFARTPQVGAVHGGMAEPMAEFDPVLSTAFDEIAAGLELVSARA